ncbi:hypothetical protein VDQ86_09630 [Xanthomonas campestris pv. campestris]|nr:hypothetical protein [Xanthomonas campestris pv. campestris]
MVELLELPPLAFLFLLFDGQFGSLPDAAFCRSLLRLGKTTPDEAAVWCDTAQVPAVRIVEGAVDHPVSQHLYSGQHMIAAGITIPLYRGGHFMNLLVIK